MEQQNILTEFEDNYVNASTGQRFVNYIIDTIAFYVLLTIVLLIVGMSMGVPDPDQGGSIMTIYFITFIVILAYYTLLEGATGKSLGKMATSTLVLKEDGSPIGFKEAFLRTLCRFVPFEVLSALFGDGLMWHDKWTGTRVVKKKI